MIESDIVKWEMRQLERNAARLYRAKRLRGEGTKRLIAGLAAFGSHALLHLGNALIASGEKLNVKDSNVYKEGKLWTPLPSK
jgi:hypothetical protein